MCQKTTHTIKLRMCVCIKKLICSYYNPTGKLMLSFGYKVCLCDLEFGLSCHCSTQPHGQSLVVERQHEMACEV